MFKWVGPIGPDDWVLLGRGGFAISLTRLEQTTSYKVGAYKGDAIAEHLLAKGVEPITVLRDQQNARKLMAGQIDLCATGDPAFRQRRVVSGLNKDVPDEVVQKLQTELEQMRSEGLVDDILSRYL